MYITNIIHIYYKLFIKNIYQYVIETYNTYITLNYRLKDFLLYNLFNFFS